LPAAGDPSRAPLGGEAELIAYGFNASVHNGAVARDFGAKLSETGGIAQGLQRSEE
jgi:hypothetical protein